MVGVRVVGTDYEVLPKMQVLLPNEWCSIRVLGIGSCEQSGISSQMANPNTSSSNKASTSPSSDDLQLGVGDIIKKIIDSRYIGIFTTYRQVIVIEKNRFGNYRKIIVIENVNLILSDKNSSKNKSKRATALLLGCIRVLSES